MTRDELAQAVLVALFQNPSAQVLIARMVELKTKPEQAVAHAIYGMVDALRLHGNATTVAYLAAEEAAAAGMPQAGQPKEGWEYCACRGPRDVRWLSAMGMNMCLVCKNPIHPANRQPPGYDPMMDTLDGIPISRVRKK